MASRVLLPGKPGYPVIPLPAPGFVSPPLYLRGALPNRRGVAIVGTRRATEGALLFTRRLVHALVEQGHAIWSGGAVGIDAAAHEAAVDAGGVTVIVGGSGADMDYPKQNLALFDRVLASGGARLAAVPDGTRAERRWFFQRNELLAVFTEATVVVEAPPQSGSRNTAKAARQHNRILAVVPSAPWSERGAGCAVELTLGAIPIARPEDLLRLLGHPAPTKPAGSPSGSDQHPSGGPRQLALITRPLDATERAVLAALADHPVHTDQVCETTRLPAHEVVRSLLTLCLEAVVVEGPPGSFRRVCRPEATAITVV
jgi:DNA processing protein